MVLEVMNLLVGLDPVLKNRKVEFKGYFRSYRGSFQDHDAGDTMVIRCLCTRDPKRGGEFRGKS